MEKRTRQWLERALGIGIAVTVLTLVALRLRDLDWAAVGQAMTSQTPTTLLAALLIALPALAACASYDLIGRRATGHSLPVTRTMLISFTGYFVSLNLGAIVGGLALRFRLYLPHGLRPLVISQIIGLSILTNWSGFAVIAGAALCLAPSELYSAWGIGPFLARFAGVLCLLTAAGYVTACALKGGASVEIRGTEFKLPTLRVAVIQLALSCVNWGASGAVIAWLLPGIGWLSVMPVLMASAVAGIWSHVPGGLGVTEAVFVTLLAGRATEAELLAGVLIFRIIYYFLPLIAALASYAYLEATAGKHKSAVNAA